ncbi:MAG TPA: hypothetical protein VIJ93_12620, partial [bacterium]
MVIFAFRISVFVVALVTQAVLIFLTLIRGIGVGIPLALRIILPVLWFVVGLVTLAVLIFFDLIRGIGVGILRGLRIIP